MGISVTDTTSIEIMNHIHNLDREESWLRKQAANADVKAKDLTRKAELLAVKRRQYEFLLNQLDGPAPVARAGVQDPFPVPAQGVVIGVLGQ